MRGNLQRKTTKKIEKEQPERKEKNQECDALDTKQRKSIREGQMPEGLELTIGFGQQKVIVDLGKNSLLKLGWSCEEGEIQWKPYFADKRFKRLQGKG